jgi:hypothetical protein
MVRRRPTLHEPAHDKLRDELIECCDEVNRHYLVLAHLLLVLDAADVEGDDAD